MSFQSLFVPWTIKTNICIVTFFEVKVSQRTQRNMIQHSMMFLKE